ncbi:hypothetical protein [Streptomyces sp. HB132]|uniref:hypothetical protein n=1 Tax=Streptomyces sp. HB132 TaxID=767388 RepID=UPI00195FA791|nr:hypothetical protein [Streptomyces sp. HB132]MBM7439034.1 hypothetical protein [Streptomyces sp. HB132]
MKETAPLPEPVTAEATDRTRFRSILSAVLFLPAALVVGVLTLSSETAGRCLTYGEACGSPLPGWLFTCGISLGAVACVVVLVALEARVRRIALAVQLLAEVTALTVILSHS